MRGGFLALALVLPGVVTAPASARSATDFDAILGGGGQQLPPYLQCVPYARQVSGISIYGDAHTWWNQAAGRYARGSEPRAGAVMAFRPHGNMRLGHVAAVSKVIDSRTVLIRHSNWSPIHGRRGQVEDDVRAIDVSPANDWSEVRVWFAPLQALGGTHWPVEGFIYRDRPGGAALRPQLTKAQPAKKLSDPIGAAIEKNRPATRSSDAIGDIIAGRSAS
jgi:surface antigen